MAAIPARLPLEPFLPLVAAAAAGGGLDERDADALAARLRRRWSDAVAALAGLYGHRDDFDDLVRRCVEVVVATAVARPPALRRLDHRREIDPDWHLRADRIGYVCYADRFAGTLAGVGEHLDHLADLGVTYLHLMPLLRPRDGENDGGYAVADYREVDPRLGTMDDLEALAALLRERGMSLCVDLVVNHTAREHAWARRAAAGEARYRAYYRLFPDRTEPDRFEATLPEVFPDTAPGSFTWFDDVGAWVWTTFHDYQWDLDHSNPEVFVELLDVMGFLANRGIEILRLDAVPFLWKRLGTDCQNQPEAHLLLQAWRALTAAAAPSLLFKAEAIVAPDQLVAYLGARPGGRSVAACELAYHNQLMVMGWSAAATRDARLAATALGRMPPPPPGTSWVTYVRGHDDIGWAVTDEDARAVGWDGPAHRRFLADFFAGDHPGSFARGARFQDDPATGARSSGTAAALAGIEEGLERGEPHLVEQGIRRLLLLYAVAASYGGVPLVYMGDELALRNDWSFLERAEHAADNRWLHRPMMDWDAAARRRTPGTIEERVFAGLAALLAARRQLPQLRADAAVRVLAVDDPAVLAFVRFHPRAGALLVLASFADGSVAVDPSVLADAGLRVGADVLDPGFATDGSAPIPVPGLGVRWLVEDSPA